MDIRKECKYGEKCYQTNEEHHKKYKHASKKRTIRETVIALSLEDPFEDKETKKVKQTDNTTDLDNSISNKIKEEEEKSKTNDNEEEAENSNQDQIIKEEEEKSKTNDNEEDVENSNEDQIIEISDSNIEQCQKFIKSKFLVRMPEDFFKFWDFCKTLSNKKPKEALEICGLHLVGPFDVLAGYFNGKHINKFSHDKYLCHWRYYYDPPEFQTILTGDNKLEQHIGYFRDDPNDMPCFVAENQSTKDCIIKPIAPNIFSAVNVIINGLSKKTDPFKKMALNRIQKKLHDWAAEHNISLEELSSQMSKRKRMVVTRTFHQAGIVVPVNKETELGYRPLMENETKLKEMLTKIKNATTPEERSARFNDLQMLLTATNIAIDECDFGTGLELGLNFFSFGCEHLNEISIQFLTNSYNLLQREEFAKISKAHINNRKRGSKLSILY